jgi:rsbT co-antagonist protein RsbR
MSRLPEIMREHEGEIQSNWLREMTSAVRRIDLLSEKQLRAECEELLSALVAGAASGDLVHLENPAWDHAKELLQLISARRVQSGFSPSETATFILSMKKPVFEAVQKELGSKADELFNEIWTATLLIDKLALITSEAYQTSREQLITRQQQEMLELSTPVVKLWDGILALPIIGTLDSARTQVVMESLLGAVVQTNSRVAIIDITGVPTVDTLVAQHLLKTITAARLMGAECIISGVRPQIAQTIVHLGIDLSQVITKAKLSDAFGLALQKSGRAVVRTTPEKSSPLGHRPATGRDYKE